jgi:brefeldin A-resistance guanine nucleotide exchange factor 1
MHRDALTPAGMDAHQSLDSSSTGPRIDAPRMQYRSRPVSVAVDPVSLVISECISITSAIQKQARSQHSSVSAILGGNPNPIQLGPPSPSLGGRGKSPSNKLGGDDGQDGALSNRWGLRGQRGKSMQDNPMIAGFGKLRHDIAGSKGSHSPSISQ